MSGIRRISTRLELVEAAGNGDVPDLLVSSDIDELPTLRLAPGQSLRGLNGTVLRFAAGADGVQLHADSTVSDIDVLTDPDRRAIFNDTGHAGFGRLELRRLRLIGCLRLLAEDAAHGGHVAASDILVEAADARGWNVRPSGYGVEVVPGVFLIWNRMADPSTLVTVDLNGIGIGRPGRPAKGSGVFLAGTPDGGRMLATRIETDDVHSDGGIAPGTADRIAGGVFVVSGAHAHRVRNRGPVTTYGPNDMVLDNWGSVDSWIAEARVTSTGPSAIGFVNFGDLRSLVVKAPIETFGVGARGFNVYDGTLGRAEFDRIATHGNGAVGLQISKPVGRISVDNVLCREAAAGFGQQISTRRQPSARHAI